MVQSTVGLFGTVAGFGLGMASTKFVAEFRHSDPVRAGRIISLASATAWITSGVLSIVLFLSAEWLAARTLAAEHLGGLLRIGALLLLFGGINGAQTGALSGFEAFKAISKISVVTGILTFPLMILGVWVGKVQGALIALVVSAAVNCLLNWIALREEARVNGIPLTYKGAAGEWSIFLNFNIPGVLNSALISFSAWACGALLVNQIDGYSGMGVFNAVKRMQQLPEIALGMLMTPFLPVLSDAFGRKDMVTYGKTLMAAFFAAMLLMVPFSLILLAAPWLALLPYGDTYRGGEPVVRWIMIGSLAYGLLWPLGSVIISLGRMWMAFGLIAVQTLLFLGVGWFLIPRYGATGYAATSAVTFIVSNIPCVCFLYSELGGVMKEFKWAQMAFLATFFAAACWVVEQTQQPWIAFSIGICFSIAFSIWRIATWSHSRVILLDTIAKPGRNVS